MTKTPGNWLFDFIDVASQMISVKPVNHPKFQYQKFHITLTSRDYQLGLLNCPKFQCQKFQITLSFSGVIHSEMYHTDLPCFFIEGNLFKLKEESSVQSSQNPRYPLHMSYSCMVVADFSTILNDHFKQRVLDDTVQHTQPHCAQNFILEGVWYDFQSDQS